MKYLLALIPAFMVVGMCLFIHHIFNTPSFKVGDCISYPINENTESWEKKETPMVFKVIEVGKNHYLTIWISPKFMTGALSSTSFQTAKVKVDCSQI